VLRKNLPVASGIGGGSADAAAALRLLCRLWQIAPDPMELAQLAVGLGADIPVCLAGRASRMGGIGEILAAAPALPECGIVLVNPGTAVATADVFRTRRGEWSKPALLSPFWPDAATMAAALAECRNDLQAAATTLQPAIGDVVQALAMAPACLLARMSGSGATCFGLFPTPFAAASAAANVRRAGWWTWGGQLRRD
jgi:4-diphosphocytidyl-2-C-methyl-D-erythritol kinase